MESKIKEILEKLLNLLTFKNFEICIEEKTDEILRVNIKVEDPSLIIGKFGNNLHSLEIILKKLVYKSDDSTPQLFIILDCNDYKKNKEEDYKKMVEDILDEDKNNESQEIHLPPMNAFYRKLMYLYINEKYKDILQIRSEGEGLQRHIVLNRL